MKIVRTGMMVVAGLSLLTGTLNAQERTVDEAEVAEQYRAQAEQLEKERAELDRQQRHEEVEKLTRYAAELRSEFNFAKAAEVEAQIRQICWDYDPRVIRVNSLKQRASAARLTGEMLDADMYEREAERVLEELKTEYGGHTDEPALDMESLLLPTEQLGQNTDTASMEYLVNQLLAEIARLNTELESRDQQMSELVLQNPDEVEID